MKRKLFYSLKKNTLAILICTGLIYQSAYAQSPGDIIHSLNAIRASLDAMVNTAATYIFQTPHSIGNVLVTNNTLQNTAIKTVAPNVKTLNDKDILTGLTPDVKNPTLNLTTLATIQASDTVLPSITLGGIPVPFYSSAVQQNMQKALLQGNENFNFQSLITPSNYGTQDSQNLALNYLRFISGYATPISNLNLSSYPESQLSSKQKLDIQNSPNYQAYQVQRRQLLARQSAALSNLYWMYSRRLPIPNVQPGDTALGIANPSVAQIEEHNATWRTASPTWYTQMSTASPTNVEREILFVLAEIQTQLHRLHQDNERMLALTAVGQLGALQMAKQTLAITEKQVLDNINSQIKSNSEQGTSNQTANTQTQLTPQQQNEARELIQSQKAAAEQAAAQANQ